MPDFQRHLQKPPSATRRAHARPHCRRPGIGPVSTGQCGSTGRRGLTLLCGSPLHRGPTVRSRLGAAAALFALALPAAVSAQVVRGRVVDPSDRAPVEGAMVVLLDEADRRRAQALSNATGGFHLEAPAPGRYRLRADRIGYRSAYTEFFELARGETLFRTVESRVDAIPLQGIDVEGSRRCSVRPEEGLNTARVWEEARKALAAAEWTDEMGVYRYRILNHERVVNLRGRNVEPPDSTLNEQFLRVPFYADPVERLISEGFVRREEGDYVYYGPDAAVLLSDVFLDTHCLRLQEGRGDARGLLGLEFEPVEDRGVVEVRGTLWLDPESSQLRWLDYEYVELDDLGLPGGDAGGRVVFQGLPNGAWIVRDWVIRMPLMSQQDRRRVAGYRLAGGTVVQVRDDAGRVVLEEGSGTVSGVVVDPTEVEPVANAEVHLVGTARRVPTDAHGVFHFSGLADGVHRVSASTPELRVLGWEGDPRTVEVRRGEVATVRIELPPVVAVALARCSGDGAAGETGVLMGTVRSSSDDAYVSGAVVRVRWPGSGASGDAPLVTRTDAAGRYVVCAVPPGRPVTLEVASGESRVTVEVRLPEESRVLVRDLRIAAGADGPGGEYLR